MTTPAQNLADADSNAIAETLNALLDETGSAHFAFPDGRGDVARVWIDVVEPELVNIRVNHGGKTARMSKAFRSVLLGAIDVVMEKFRLSTRQRGFIDAVSGMRGGDFSLIRSVIHEPAWRRGCAQELEGELVYLIQQGEDGPIKIGRTNRLVQRIGELQVGNPTPLRLLAVTRKREEKSVHFHFDAFRIRGEWFHPHPTILDFVEEVLREEPGQP